MRAIITISLNDWRKQSGLTCSFIIFAALNVAFMYVGITNLHSCPVEKMVPIYLVGKGQVSHASLFTLLFPQFTVHYFLIRLDARNPPRPSKVH